MNIERHISNLKQYIKDDEIIEKDGSDFANFCKGHIDDIQALIDYIETMQSEFDRLEGIEDNTAMLKYELEKKDKQLQEKQNIINKLSRECQKNFDLAMETEIERITANKAIDNMAEYISKLDIEEDICMKNIANTEMCNEEHSNCKECIKKHFYKED